MIHMHHDLNGRKFSLVHFNADETTNEMIAMIILMMILMINTNEIFCEHRTNNLCSGHTKGFENNTTYRRNFLLVHFDVFRMH